MTALSMKHYQYDTCTELTTLTAVIQMIKTGTYAQQVNQIRNTKNKAESTELKNHLPMFFCCTFTDPDDGVSKRNLKDHTGIMVLDIDGITIEQAETYKQMIADSRFRSAVIAAFISPSGGLKIMIQTDFTGTDPDLYSYVYKRLSTLFTNEIGLPDSTLDPSTSNVNRGTYFSYDPCLYQGNGNTLKIVQKVKPDYDAIKQQELAELETTRQIIADSEYQADAAKQWTDERFRDHLSNMRPGNRHDVLWDIARDCFSAGMNAYDLTVYYQTVKASGHWTETLSPQAKAEDAYRSWSYGGKGQVQRRFWKEDYDAQRARRAKMWRD